jgi:hypothetical protein
MIGVIKFAQAMRHAKAALKSLDQAQRAGSEMLADISKVRAAMAAREAAAAAEARQAEADGELTEEQLMNWSGKLPEGTRVHD